MVAKQGSVRRIAFSENEAREEAPIPEMPNKRLAFLGLSMETIRGKRGSSIAASEIV
jgi:hypothetical protein